MPQPRIRKSRVGVEITAYKSGHTERLLAVMTPRQPPTLPASSKPMGKGISPQSLGDWLADKIAADIKKLDIPVTL